jgi:hypothetical protein
LAPDASVRRWQNRLTPAWKRVAGGRHLNRPIQELVQQAGFDIAHLETGYVEGPRPMTLMYGRVRAPLLTSRCPQPHRPFYQTAVCYGTMGPASLDRYFAEDFAKHWGETGGTLGDKDKEIWVRMGKFKVTLPA